MDSTTACHGASTTARTRMLRGHPAGIPLEGSRGAAMSPLTWQMRGADQESRSQAAISMGHPRSTRARSAISCWTKSKAADKSISAPAVPRRVMKSMKPFMTPSSANWPLGAGGSCASKHRCQALKRIDAMAIGLDSVGSLLGTPTTRQVMMSASSAGDMPCLAPAVVRVKSSCTSSTRMGHMSQREASSLESQPSKPAAPFASRNWWENCSKLGGCQAAGATG
mmetsp:Transcript_44962/g.130069  ORF Transcript_44962/g.130069 Transcript_44962/m.130069 type:complete len:224 (-) Transcript_44962:217-888(-)